MKKFSTHRGKICLLDRANVDTDQIIPKQFLKSIKRTGFGENLFQDWRYFADGKPDPDFALNKPAFQGASILVTRHNFGSGSSREHAVWAVLQYGFQVVIAPSKNQDGAPLPGFADIFRNNAGKNGLLTVQLEEKEVDEIFKQADLPEGLEATVNLEKQTVTLHGQKETRFRFQIEPDLKERLLQGLDDIGITLRHADAIQKYEETKLPAYNRPAR